jgi:hypothetical protein
MNENRCREEEINNRQIVFFGEEEQSPENPHPSMQERRLLTFHISMVAKL